MGKRSDFPRRAQDAYDTPAGAIIPLLRHIPNGTRFIEPCAGKGDLIRVLEASKNCRCVGFFDIEPRSPEIPRGDALKGFRHNNADMIITNPPWTREILHPMIERFSAMRPTWLLFDADWMHTKQAEPYLKLCHKIVSVGRVKWIPDSPHTGKDNCQWLLFDKDPAPHGGPIFYGRQA